MENIQKRYVDVLVLFRDSGQMEPKIIYWDEDKKFYIDKILDIRPCASRKAGGQGDRYLCLINGREHAIYFEDPAWFVEERIKNNPKTF